jgi:hypothetical protein
MSGFVGALSSNPLLVSLTVLAILIVFRAQGSVDADVAWQLWIGRQLNHGARLYRDIIEVNPPLWFWMAAPVDQLSTLMHLRSDHVLMVLVGCAAALSLVATDRLIRFIEPLRRTMLLAYATLILVAMPWVDFGQREHIALIGAIPYAALLAARRGGRRVPVGLAIAVGAAAALGFALKHYFLVVPVLLELWFFAGQPKKWRPFRPETLAILFVGLVYAAALLLAARDYFTTVLPMLLLAYGATGAKHVVDLFQPAVLTALVSIGLLLSNRRFLRSETLTFAAALTVAAVGFTISYFLQAKGWSYHSVPMLGCAALALAACFASGPNPPRLMIFAAPALLCLPFTIAAQHAQAKLAYEDDVGRAVSDIPAGESIGFVSVDPSFGWHDVLQRGFRFPMRYFGFWMAQAIVSNDMRRNPDPRLIQLKHRVVREIVADFECTPPQRILVARPTAEAARAGEFDILPFLLREPELAKLIGHYRPISRSSIEVFELASPLPRPVSCPAWSPV